MALTKVPTYDCELRGEYSIRIRQITTIQEDGVDLSHSFARYVMHPDSDLDYVIPQFGDVTIPANIKRICQAQFTDECKAGWAAVVAANDAANADSEDSEED